jgi:hypothetical protein
MRLSAAATATLVVSVALTRRFILLWAPALALAARGKKKPNPEELTIAIAEFNVRRLSGERIIAIDGSLRNSGLKPIHKLVLVFEFLGPDEEIISRQRGAIDEEDLDPGDESEFHWQMRDQARAVDLRISAVARSADYVKVEQPGPYVIQ